MHLLCNIKLNVLVTQNHYEASIKNFVLVKHELQTQALQNYQNRKKSAILINLRNAACIRKHVQTGQEICLANQPEEHFIHASGNTFGRFNTAITQKIHTL
jgi:hypothetical protein